MGLLNAIGLGKKIDKGLELADQAIIDKDKLNELKYTLEQAKLKMIWEENKITGCVVDMSNTTLIKANVAAATDSIEL